MSDDRGGCIRTPAAAMAATIRAGAAVYERMRMLPRLLPLSPEETADLTAEGTRRVLHRLAGALRAERRRGRAGHWTYDLNRHIGLRQAWLAERTRLASLERNQSAPENGAETSLRATAAGGRPGRDGRAPETKKGGPWGRPSKTHG